MSDVVTRRKGFQPVENTWGVRGGRVVGPGRMCISMLELCLDSVLRTVLVSEAELLL